MWGVAASGRSGTRTSPAAWYGSHGPHPLLRRVQPLSAAAIRKPRYDAGPEARIAHGNIELGQQRPDPDRPMLDQDGIQIGYHLTAGARVRSGYDYLHRTGAITTEQRDIAERYVLTVERFHGARDGATPGAGRLAAWQTAGPSEAQVNAASDLRRAVNGVGNGAVQLIGAVMLDGLSLTQVARIYGEDQKSVAGRLRAALDRLMEVWQ